MKIDINAQEGNAFYIIGQVRRFMKEIGDPNIHIEKVTKAMYECGYEELLEVAVEETKGWLEFWKDDEPYVVFEDPRPTEQEDLMKEFEIVFTPDFDPTPNGEQIMNKWIENIWTNQPEWIAISARRRGSQLVWVRLPSPDDGFKQKFDCEKYEYMINV